ncbi:hypothetical protein, partial [Acinetobacter terrestris]|uniref:hypothetical protein n=1 Tax=Acinetobacter terrestris TaxID=2529843 RepID=UPI001BE48552
LIIKLSEYLDIFIENLLKSRVFDFLLLSPIICGEHYQAMEITIIIVILAIIAVLLIIFYKKKK